MKSTIFNYCNNTIGVILVILCIVFGFYESMAQFAISQADVLEEEFYPAEIDFKTYLPPEANDFQISKDDVLSTQTVAFQTSIKIELEIRAEYIYNHVPPGKLKRQHLFLCSMKDDFLGRPQKFGFCAFFRQINHVKDFTTHVLRPNGDGFKELDFDISTPDPGYTCSIVRIEPKKESQGKSSIFRNQMNVSNMISTRVDSSTKEGIYRYSIVFTISGDNGNKTYRIDPTVKVH